MTAISCATVGWVSLLVMVYVDTRRQVGDPMPPGFAIAAVLAVGVAIAGTVTAVLLYALPRLYATWRDGVQMGQEMSAWQQRRRHNDVPPALRSVGDGDRAAGEHRRR